VAASIVVEALMRLMAASILRKGIVTVADVPQSTIDALSQWICMVEKRRIYLQYYIAEPLVRQIFVETLATNQRFREPAATEASRAWIRPLQLLVSLRVPRDSVSQWLRA